MNLKTILQYKTFYKYARETLAPKVKPQSSQKETYAMKCIFMIFLVESDGLIERSTINQTSHINIISQHNKRATQSSAERTIFVNTICIVSIYASF